MINGLCKEGLLDEALTLLANMKDNGCIPNAITFEVMIHALFEKDENDKTEELLSEIVARVFL